MGTPRCGEIGSVDDDREGFGGVHGPEPERLECIVYQGELGWLNEAPQLTVQLGPLAKEFLQGKRKLTMDFRQKSPVKGAPAALRKTKSTTSLPQRKNGQANINDYAKPTQRVVSNPISRKRSLQQIRAEEDAFDNSGWGDTDDDYQQDDVDPIELSGDETEMDEAEAPAVKRRKSMGGVATARKDLGGTGKVIPVGGKKGKAKDVPDRQDNRTPVEKCLAALKEVVQKVRLSLLLYGIRMS